MLITKDVILLAKVMKLSGRLANGVLNWQYGRRSNSKNDMHSINQSHLNFIKVNFLDNFFIN